MLVLNADWIVGKAILTDLPSNAAMPLTSMVAKSIQRPCVDLTLYCCDGSSVVIFKKSNCGFAKLELEDTSLIKIRQDKLLPIQRVLGRELVCHNLRWRDLPTIKDKMSAEEAAN